MKSFLKFFALFMAMFTANLNAAATNFAEAAPTSLLPEGFWDLVLLVFALVVTIGGIIIAMKLIKRARG